MQTNYSFYGEQNEICINVSLMYFIQEDEGVLLEKFSAMHESL
jgi:hypothetical protein